MKKFFLGIILTCALIFSGSQNNQAEAYNYDVGIYSQSGLRGYLMTETIRTNYSNGSFSCTVVCYPSNRPYYINYQFYQGRNGFVFRNSDGYSAQLSAYYTPVEFNVYRYVWLGER